MLFDASRKLLDSRFLKKDEVIRSGESVAAMVIWLKLENLMETINLSWI